LEEEEVVEVGGSGFLPQSGQNFAVAGIAVKHREQFTWPVSSFASFLTDAGTGTEVGLEVVVLEW